MGNLLILEGKRIRIEGTDDTVGLYFDSVSGPEVSVRLGQDSLCRNNPSVLECIVPEELRGGEAFRIRLVTQYMPGGKQRENPLSFTFPTLFRPA